MSTKSNLSPAPAEAPFPHIESVIRTVAARQGVEVEPAAQSTTTVTATPEELQELLKRLNGAICIVGSVEAALRGEDSYHGGALRESIATLEHVASELDAAFTVGAQLSVDAGTAEQAGGPALAPAQLALAEYLIEQQNRASELVSLLERLDEDDDTPICMRVAVRMARELEDALDRVTLGGLVKAGEEAAQL